MIGTTAYSLVKILPESEEGSYCGYCSAKDGSFSDRIWSNSLTVTAYQSLVERGWARDGRGTFKPIMDRTCCPQYASRCDALNFCLSKSQKKVIKRMHKFLAYGVGEERITAKASRIQPTSAKRSNKNSKPDDTEAFKKLRKLFEFSTEPSRTICNAAGSHFGGQKKAKELHRSRIIQKQRDQGQNNEETEGETSFEEFLEKYSYTPKNSKHVLECRLVPADKDHALFSETFDESFSLYKKYEHAIYRNLRQDKDQFYQWLGHSPLKRQLGAWQNDTEVPAFGSFHMQYLLDGKLIAVDVLDILPAYILSRYFCYDPDYRFLSLGTFSVIREIEMARNMNKLDSEMKFVSLGFYVQSCKKMQYKADFNPSFLLCPETYIWCYLPDCLPKFTVTPHPRLDRSETDEEIKNIQNDLSDTLIFWNRTIMTADIYAAVLESTQLGQEQKTPDEFLTNIARFVPLIGPRCLASLVFHSDKPDVVIKNDDDLLSEIDKESVEQAPEVSDWHFKDN